MKALSRAEIEKLSSMWKSPGYLATLIAVGCAFASWSILLPVVPLGVLEAGGSDTLGGATTGVFMAATVITQMLTPRALRRVGYSPTMVAAALLLGVPSLGYLLGMSAGPVLAFSALRGVGFGALTVAQTGLIAELVPIRFLGKATAMLGLAVGLGQLVFLPTGLWLVGTGLGFTGVYWIAAGISFIAGLMCLRIPQLYASRHEPADGVERPRRAATWKLVTVPALAINSLAMSYGAISSFLSPAVREIDPVTGAVIGGMLLSIVGGTGMLGRFASGIIADRRGRAGATMIPAQAVAMVGMALTTTVLWWGWSSWWLVAAAVLFGTSFGLVQNEVLLMMFSRLPRERVSDASALWNIAYDSGTGLGSFLLGAVAAQTAYADAYGVCAALIAVGLVITVADRISGRHRIAEFNNTRARLRQVPVARRAVHGVRAIRRGWKDRR